jgi:hypothetical protein
MRHIVLLALALAVSGCATNAPTPAQVKYREMYAAGVESSAVRYLACVSHNAHAECFYHAPKIEGLALYDDEAGNRALAQLWANVLDTEYAYLRDCTSLVRGKALLPALRALDPKQANQKCLAMLAAPVNAGDFPNARPARVCYSEADVQAMVAGIISQIEAGKKCEPWNID